MATPVSRNQIGMTTAAAKELDAALPPVPHTNPVAKPILLLENVSATAPAATTIRPWPNCSKPRSFESAPSGAWPAATMGPRRAARAASPTADTIIWTTWDTTGLPFSFGLQIGAAAHGGGLSMPL